MTVYVRAATAYQMSNWWTKLVEKNRQSVLTVKLDGTVAGTHFSQTKLGDPIELRKNDSMVDLGHSEIVVERLPTTFSGMTFNLEIDKTAKDGLNDLITIAADMSKAQPPTLSITQQQLGIITLSKSLADYLFSKRLLVKKLSTQSPIPSTGLLRPGVYVCLAGDTNADYAKYLAPGNPGLQWDGAQLTYNNGRVQKVSYFIVEVAYQKRFFAKPLDALSYGGVKPWASLYLLAEAEVPNINSAAEAKKIHDEIQSHLSDARSLLNADYDFIAAEKTDIANAVHDELQKNYTARLRVVGADSSEHGQPTKSQTPHSLTMPPPLVLFSEDRSAHEKEAAVLRQIEQGNRTMVPTGGMRDNAVPGLTGVH
ncbi:MAG TPA: hypothetical protein VN956_24780 [Pyrinomonadaceae bacterium]|nr:hypothetical protein [Pyrinomonadaceae bacterium]